MTGHWQWDVMHVVAWLCLTVAGPTIHRTRNCKRRQSQNVHDVPKMCPICCVNSTSPYTPKSCHDTSSCYTPWLFHNSILHIEGEMHFLSAESAKQRGKMHRTCWTHIQSPELFRWNGDANMLRQHSCEWCSCNTSILIQILIKLH